MDAIANALIKNLLIRWPIDVEIVPHALKGIKIREWSLFVV